MYFVHPQIQFKNIGKVFAAMLAKSDEPGLVQKLSPRFPGKQLVFTDMARTAFRMIVERLNLQNTHLLMPAYICDIFYPILKQFNIEPIFLDIHPVRNSISNGVDPKTFQPSLEEIKSKITSKAKALLVCHTYGLPADMESILALAKENNLLVIEDCAHAFGAKINGRYAGSFGHAALFSLYKSFPCLRGGLAILPAHNALRSEAGGPVVLPKTSFNFRDFLSLLNSFPFFAFLFKKFGSDIAPKILRQEKLADIAGLNRVSLNLFAAFLDNFERGLEKRKELALFFQQGLTDLGFETQASPRTKRPQSAFGTHLGGASGRYGAGASQNNVFCFLSALVPSNLTEKRDDIGYGLTQKGIFCTRIWHTPIILNPEARAFYFINRSDFPGTIAASQRIINFPLQNHYTKQDIQKMLAKIKQAVKNQ